MIVIDVITKYSQISFTSSVPKFFFLIFLFYLDYYSIFVADFALFQKLLNDSESINDLSFRLHMGFYYDYCIVFKK